MQRNEVFEEVKKIVSSFCKNQDALENATEDTNFIEDLDMNSARLVDVVIDMEDAFDIEIDDDSAGEIYTMRDAIDLILAKKAS